MVVDPIREGETPTEYHRRLCAERGIELKEPPARRAYLGLMTSPTEPWRREIRALRRDIRRYVDRGLESLAAEVGQALAGRR